MIPLPDGEGDLKERHEFFCVNGVRYLVEPLHEVSAHDVQLSLLRITFKCSRRNHC